jgi:glycosyltransferase involved in cell wall biosynthesis
MEEQPAGRACDLSILLDTETLQITGEIAIDGRLSLWREAARRIEPRTFEIVLCSNKDLGRDVLLPEGIKLMVRPGAGYYALKNEGAREAVGEIIFWGDIDCRPDPDYFVHLLAYFDAHSPLILGGRSSYDGGDFATRANSATSFGYLHGIDILGTGDCYVAHNVAVKRDSSLDYFGPYTERYGGDEYITACYRNAGERLTVEQKMIVYHESPAHSLRGWVDRNIREIARLAFISEEKSPTPWKMVQMARKLSRYKWRLYKDNAYKFGITRREKWKARILYGFYSWINLFSAILMLIFPSLLQKWIKYQFGDLKNCQPVGTQGRAVEESAAKISLLRARQPRKTLPDTAFPEGFCSRSYGKKIPVQDKAKMTLGIFIDTWVDGGSRLFPRRLETELTRLGYTVYLILGDNYPWHDRKAREGYERLKTELGERCFSLEREVIHSKKWVKHRLKQFVINHQISCLLINDYKNFMEEMKFIAEFIPMVSIAHSDHSDYYHSEFLVLEPSISATVSPSRHIHSQLQMLTPPRRHAKLHRIPYGVKKTDCFQEMNSGPMKVIVCSRIDFYQKRLQDLPGIWKNYLALGGSGHLTIVGSGDALNYIHKELAHETATKRVNILGQVNAEEVQNILAAGDVFLSTSNYEGLPQTVLEAVCNGLYPLLTKINSGHQEIIDDLGAGRSYPVGDTEGCARELLALEQELKAIRNQRRQIREKALSLYSLDQVVSSYASLLQEISHKNETEGQMPDYRPTLKERFAFLRHDRQRRRRLRKAR